MNDWSKPQEVSDVQMVFPANIEALMPARSTCQAALEAMPDKGEKWIDVQHAWFFHGLSGESKIQPKAGIDPRQAIRHLHVIQGSFEPKHEHKRDAVAYLLSLWFDDFIVVPSTK